MKEIKQPIAEQTANQIKLHSTVFNSAEGQDVVGMTLMARALLFAELSMIAYFKPEQTKKAAKRLGFSKTVFYDNDGSQAYVFSNEANIVIAFRGTEPNEWNDVKADLDAAKALAETVGRVHRGFKKEVDDLWPQLKDILVSNKNNLAKNLWFTGHSLGGAMASICAGRCLLSSIDTVPEQVHTFGSPRVGTKRYINYAKIDYYRWVNNNDIVTRTPPAWLGYRHSGKEMYLDAHGKLRELNKIQRSADTWKGFVMGLKNREIDYFNDHLIDRYVDYIFNNQKRV